MLIEAVTKFLKDEFPWFLTDASVKALRDATQTEPAPRNIDELRSKTARFGHEGRLQINYEWKNAWREHLSIFQDVEDNTAEMLLFFERKKKADEAAQLTSLRQQLRGFHVVDRIGQRLDIDKLPPAELRKHVATIAENR